MAPGIWLMSFGKKNQRLAAPRHRRPPTTPPLPADEALYHARLAGAAALRAIPDVRVPWSKLRHLAITGAMAAVAVCVGGFAIYRHVSADAASRGYSSIVRQLNAHCHRLNSELVNAVPLNCSDLFSDVVAERMTLSEYWLRFAGFEAAPEERRKFVLARAELLFRARASQSLRTKGAVEPTRVESPTYEPNFDIAEMCRRKWTDNYQMEAFCLNQQEEARSWSKGRQIELRIAKHCMTSWSRDWQMFQFCVRKEEDARDRIGR